LGQPRKLDQSHPKKIQKVGWFGLLDEYGFKNEKSKNNNNGFRVKQDTNPLTQ